VHEHVVKMMGLSSTNKDVIKVRIANGQQISSLRKCEDFSLKMQGTVF
jgi:hypothetical protein